MREVSSPIYQPVKVEGPSFPTGRASQKIWPQTFAKNIQLTQQFMSNILPPQWRDPGYLFQTNPFNKTDSSMDSLIIYGGFLDHLWWIPWSSCRCFPKSHRFKFHLKLTANPPENRPGPNGQEEMSSSNYPFSGAMLVSGRVTSPGWDPPTTWMACGTNHGDWAVNGRANSFDVGEVLLRCDFFQVLKKPEDMPSGPTQKKR